MRHASVPLDATLGNDGKEEGTVPQQRVSCVRDCSTKRELIRSPSRGRPESRLNRVVFMNSALNTEVGSLNRIEYITLSTIQFYSSGSAMTHYSQMPFRISPPVLPPYSSQNSLSGWTSSPT